MMSESQSDQRAGLASQMLKDIQARAQAEGIPVWLEATTPYSKQLYERLGFETVEDVVLGKGKAGPDGLKKAGGEGVTVAAMIWWPDGKRTIKEK
jgi:hypothetical protein